MTVTGFGFNSPNIVAIIDGEDCAVTQYSLDSFSCKVAEKSSVSVTNSARVGSNGIRREIYDYKSYLAVSNSGSTELEVMKNEDFLPNRTRVELSFEKPFQWNYESHLSILQDVDSSFDPT